jgi:hypothetical protein
MSENIARNMYSSQGIINYPMQLHLVGHFRTLYHDTRKHEHQAVHDIVVYSSITFIVGSMVETLLERRCA